MSESMRELREAAEELIEFELTAYEHAKSRSHRNGLKLARHFLSQCDAADGDELRLSKEDAERVRNALSECLVVVDEAFEKTGYIRVAKTSVQRAIIEQSAVIMSTALGIKTPREGI